MISFLKELFGFSELKKLRRHLDVKRKEALAYQRNGKLREYAHAMSDIQTLEEMYVEISTKEKKK